MDTGCAHLLGLLTQRFGRVQQVISNVGVRNVLLEVPLEERVGRTHLGPLCEPFAVPQIILGYGMELR
ncbi:hypothetical protein D3C80_2177500 [compost metagenome]